MNTWSLSALTDPSLVTTPESFIKSQCISLLSSFNSFKVMYILHVMKGRLTWKVTQFGGCSIQVPQKFIPKNIHSVICHLVTAIFWPPRMFLLMPHQHVLIATLCHSEQLQKHTRWSCRNNYIQGGPPGGQHADCLSVHALPEPWLKALSWGIKLPETLQDGVWIPRDMDHDGNLNQMHFSDL